MKRMKRLCFGDMKLVEGNLAVHGDYRILESFDKAILNSDTLTDEWLLVDADALRLSVKQIEWILTKAKADVMVITKKPGLRKKAWGKGVTVYRGEDWGEKSFWNCVDAVLFGRDRQKVYDMLVDNKPPILPLLKFLASDIYPPNIEALQEIDMLTFDVRPIYLYGLMAFSLSANPQKHWPRYRFPKKEKTHATSEIQTEKTRPDRWARENIEKGTGFHPKQGHAKSSVSRQKRGRKKSDRRTHRSRSLLG
jgi:hypothetical protein